MISTRCFPIALPRFARPTMPDGLSRQIEACKSRIASVRSLIRAMQALGETSSEAEQQLAREVAPAHARGHSQRKGAERGARAGRGRCGCAHKATALDAAEGPNGSTHRPPSRLARHDGLRGRTRFERPWREQQSACSPSGAVAQPYELLHSSCQLLAVAADFSAHAWQRPVMASTSRSSAFAADPHSEQRGSKLRAFAFQSSQDMISRNLA